MIHGVYVVDDGRQVSKCDLRVCNGGCVGFESDCSD